MTAENVVVRKGADLSIPQVSLPGPRSTSSVQAGEPLPTPPTHTERFAYAQGSPRWVLLAQFATTILAVISLVAFVRATSWAWWLLIPMVLSLSGALMSLLSTLPAGRFKANELDDLARDWKPSRFASVDVFLPTAGEPLAYLRNTYAAVAQLQWGGSLKVLVLDDGDRPEVASLASEFGFEYHSRPDRGHLKKAGNLRHGYRMSHGDFILILDADFVPSPRALYDVLPHFDDPSVGILQTPQFFSISEDQGWIQRAAGATQVLFYRWIQPAWDRSNAAICVGTSAVYRRSALEAVGGFAQIGHSEDIFTGLNLMVEGFVTRYVPTVIARGVCPSTFNEFVQQQYRWCQGSMALLLDRSFHRSRLTWRQRLCLYSGFLYYVTTAINVFVEWLPVLLLLLIDPTRIGPSNYAFIFLAMSLRAALVPLITQDAGTWTGLTRIQTLYSFSHAVAIFDALRGREAKWVPTKAVTSTPLSSRIHRLTTVTIVGVQVLTWTGLVVRLPEVGLDLWPVAVFAVLHLATMWPLIAPQHRLAVARSPRTARA